MTSLSASQYECWEFYKICRLNLTSENNDESELDYAKKSYLSRYLLIVSLKLKQILEVDVDTTKFEWQQVNNINTTIARSSILF